MKRIHAVFYATHWLLRMVWGTKISKIIFISFTPFKRPSSELVQTGFFFVFHQQVKTWLIHILYHFKPYTAVNGIKFKRLVSRRCSSNLLPSLFTLRDSWGIIVIMPLLFHSFFLRHITFVFKKLFQASNSLERVLYHRRLQKQRPKCFKHCWVVAVQFCNNKAMYHGPDFAVFLCYC